MAKEIFKVEEVAEVMANFMNGVMNGEKGAYENAVGTLKTRYELSRNRKRWYASHCRIWKCWHRMSARIST